MNPELVYSDFEKAAQNAFRFHFPGVKLKGCWFHFRQAIIKHAFEIGMKPLYNRDSYRIFLNLIGALAHY